MLHVVALLSYYLFVFLLNGAGRGSYAAQLRVSRYHGALVDEGAGNEDLSSVKQTAVPSLLTVLETTTPPPLFGAEAVESPNEMSEPSQLALWDTPTSDGDQPDEELSANEREPTNIPSLLTVEEGAEHRPLALKQRKRYSAIKQPIDNEESFEPPPLGAPESE